jgi:hypothetical protein
LFSRKAQGWFDLCTESGSIFLWNFFYLTKMRNKFKKVPNWRWYGLHVYSDASGVQKFKFNDR